MAVSKQFIPKFTLLPGSHAPCYKVCLSTSFLSKGLFRAGQTSAAKGIFAAHTGSLKKTGSFDWIQPAARLLAAVGNATKKKKVTACAVSSVYVGGGLGTRQKQKRKSLRRSAPSQGFFAFQSFSRSRSAAPGNACGREVANKRQTLLF